MKIVVFVHSLESCWNHGNAHFLRGVLRDLALRGHDVVTAEPFDSWSRANLVKDHGEEAATGWRRFYPELRAPRRHADLHEALALCEGADLVLVHEWNAPELVAALGRKRAQGASFTLLFHDTHHRAVSDEAAMRRFDLDAYDGVLAFGETLADIYRKRGWGRRSQVWHEAADTRLFRPPEQPGPRSGLVWIGNWGDGERSAEIDAFLLEPAQRIAASLDIYGVRYPDDALAMLAARGAHHHGWIANAETPQVFARHAATIHVPRRFYRETLPGIPTIRVFEALACGIPLISAPWRDDEHLFRTGDMIFAKDGEAMARAMRAVLDDSDMRDELAARGRETILARHTCSHRVDELLSFVEAIRSEREAQAS